MRFFDQFQTLELQRERERSSILPSDLPYDVVGYGNWTGGFLLDPQQHVHHVITLVVSVRDSGRPPLLVSPEDLLHDAGHFLAVTSGPAVEVDPNSCMKLRGNF